eukprot:361271-Chlamydomonas_euryale.AAC.8
MFPAGGAGAAKLAARLALTLPFAGTQVGRMPDRVQKDWTLGKGWRRTTGGLGRVGPSSDGSRAARSLPDTPLHTSASVVAPHTSPLSVSPRVARRHQHGGNSGGSSGTWWCATQLPWKLLQCAHSGDVRRPLPRACVRPAHDSCSVAATAAAARTLPLRDAMAKAKQRGNGASDAAIAAAAAASPGKAAKRRKHEAAAAAGGNDAGGGVEGGGGGAAGAQADGAGARDARATARSNGGGGGGADGDADGAGKRSVAKRPVGNATASTAGTAGDAWASASSGTAHAGAHAGAHTGVHAPGTGRNYTVSIAVPGSCVAMVSRGGGGGSGGAGPAALAAAAAIAGQIARAAVAGRVDEVVVYDDEADASASAPSALPQPGQPVTVSPAAAFLAQALQLLETPPCLRSALCPLLPDTVRSGVGALAPLAAPHHLGQHEWAPFREGVVLKSSCSGGGGGGSGSGSGHAFVDVGLDRMAYVPEHLPVRARVTLAMGDKAAQRFVPEYSETMLAAEVRPLIFSRVFGAGESGQ